MIYTGTWLDAEDVPFDPDSFVINTTAGGGTSRSRIHGRRGGCGSPPGMFHGNAEQAAVRISLTNRMKAYVDMPPASPDTEWEVDGQAADHYTRAGAFKKMHGQAFYPRSSVPPDYAGRTFPSSPDATKTFPPIDQIRCQYNPAFIWAQVDLHFTDAFDGGAFSGISIFQVYPRSAGKSWERKHTRRAGGAGKIQVIGAGWGDYPFDVIWPSSDPSGLRVFVRVWYNQAFSPWAPINSQAY